MSHKPVKRSQLTQSSHVCDPTCASTGRQQEGGEPRPERCCSRAHPRPWEPGGAAPRPSRRTRWTAGPDAGGLLTFGAHEAPAHVDMGVMPLALPGSEVVRADDAVGRDHRASRRQTRVPTMVGDRASDTPHHFTWRRGDTPEPKALSRAPQGTKPPQVCRAAAEIHWKQLMNKITRVGG